MRYETERCAILSREDNNPEYWADDVYPDWTVLKLFRYFPDQKIGCGVEPHYHDCDEIWMFIDGVGEAWLDGVSQPVRPGTFVFTPQGVVHRFQMFSDFRNAALRTRLVGQQRGIHLIPDEHGSPQKTGDGFSVAADAGLGRIVDPQGRFPLTELRVSRGIAAAQLATLDATEYWLAIDGRLVIEVDGVSFRLDKGDLAILRAGTARSVSSGSGVHGFAKE